MRFLLMTLMILAAACSTTRHGLDEPLHNPDSQNVIDTHTKFYRKYDGLYESFRVHATLLSLAAQNAILDQRGEFLKWDHKKLNDEREKARQEMATQTVFFLQFYAPETEYNDLNRYNTIWHIYMEVDGRRFEGKARKAHGKPIEFQAIYPDYDRFSTPYEIVFNISTADATSHNVKFVMASTLGDAELSYPSEH